MTIKKGDKVSFNLPGTGNRQVAEVTDVLEKCVQVKYNNESYSNLLTLDKDKILETLPEAPKLE
ncbi:MAG TPA: hypothetical protein PLU85_07040 [Bacteroidia bacterium]|nr:hypothetical protein [Bacteroidia bacterium]QQR94125.1 MAG: hypothetical protein IPJ93_09435 [Bacteroidota bacterium]MBP7713160.1 hypothetical protein [Bacteroidia bacterium]MBP8668761.1 hypothetical protein [Bacteroidia bacterium]HQW17451.1 hypothetical protein [Bacteroidia bacterium]